MKHKPKAYRLRAEPATIVVTPGVSTATITETDFKRRARRVAALAGVERRRKREKATKLRKRKDKLAAIAAFKDALPLHVNAAQAIREAFPDAHGRPKSLSTVYRWLASIKDSHFLRTRN
jgi:hypothetical protein